MEKIKLIDTEAFETRNVFTFDVGDVIVVEREVHEVYGFGRRDKTRLIIDDALDRARSFIARSREEFAELNSILEELTAGRASGGAVTGDLG